MHDPLRLTVVLYASAVDVDAVLVDSPQVAGLVANEWLTIVAIEPGSGEAALLGAGAVWSDLGAGSAVGGRGAGVAAGCAGRANAPVRRSPRRRRRHGRRAVGTQPRVQAE